MPNPRILDLARARAAQKRLMDETVQQTEQASHHRAAMALREELARILGEADPSYPALLAELEARALRSDERASIGLTDDPQDGAVAFEHGPARVIVRVTRERGTLNQVRWRFYGAQEAGGETRYPYGASCDWRPIGQEMWWHLLDALAPAAADDGRPPF